MNSGVKIGINSPDCKTIEPIKQIVTSFGFQYEYYFSTIFKNKTGTAPGKYR